MRVANREKKIWVHTSLVWKTDLVHSDSFIYKLTKPPDFNTFIYFNKFVKNSIKYQDEGCSQIATYMK